MTDPAESDFFAGVMGDGVRAMIDPGESGSLTGVVGDGILFFSSL